MNETERLEKYDLARRFYLSLTASEKLSPEKLIAHQRDVATSMLQHVDAHVPFYRDRLAPIRKADNTYDFSRWGEIPLMTKADLRDNFDDLQPSVIPPAHGVVGEAESSATTGIRVKVPTTDLTHLVAASVFFRSFHSFGFAWTTDMAMIRAFARMPRASRVGNDEVGRWGPPWLSDKKSGEQHFFSVNEHPEKQIEWLKSKEPVGLNTSPSNAQRLARWIADHDVEPPDITVLLTVGEAVTPDLRDQCRRYLNCEIIDAFSTAECGAIAFQCPVSGGYHIQSEIVLAEIINDAGAPCAVGEPGRLVATPLMNFAMPLIRYRFDDYMVPGPPCACGRPGPLIEKILGRRDILIDFADGSFDQLPVSHDEMARYVGKRRWQLAQTGKKSFELRFMETATAGEAPDIAGIRRYIKKLAGTGMKVSVMEVDAIGLASSGKRLTIVNERIG